MKTKNKRINALLLVLMAILLLAGTTVSAQAPIKGTVTVLSTVNIFESSIVAQDKSDIKISFSVVNREQIQPQLKYSVRLTTITNSKESLMDEKVYDDVFNIGQGEKISRTINYSAPDFLKGKYKLYLSIRNSKGLILASVLVGDVILEGSGQFLEIIPASCFISIPGESGNKKYPLAQGVDVSEEEKLIGVCDVRNNFKSSISATPQFKTYYRTVFGELISTDSQAPLNFKAGEKKTISLILPKASKPQSYDANLTFLDSGNEAISNSIPFHYVIRGVSATIQNLRLDKDSYSAGETANILFNWSGSADANLDARVRGKVIENAVILLTIKDGGGKSCSQPIETKASESGMMSIRASIKTDCQNPIVIAEIKDINGNLLDKNTFSIKSKKTPNNGSTAKKWTTDPINLLGKFYSIMGLLILILGVIIYYFRRRNIQKNKNLIKTILLCIILGGAFLLLAPGARADTFIVKNALYGDNSHSATFTVNLENGIPNEDGIQVFYPGETIDASGSAFLINCGNSTMSASLKLNINGITQDFFKDIEEKSPDGVFIPVSTLTFIAPSTTGNYEAVFTGTFKERIYCRNTDDCDLDWNEFQTLVSQGQAVPISGSDSEYWLTFEGSYSMPFIVRYDPNIQPPTINFTGANSASGPFSDQINVNNYGDPAYLKWTTTNATSCTASNSLNTADWTGSKPTTSGASSVIVHPPAIIAYILSCTGPGGSISDSVGAVACSRIRECRKINPNCANLACGITVSRLAVCEEINSCTGEITVLNPSTLCNMPGNECVTVQGKCPDCGSGGGDWIEVSP